MSLPQWIGERTRSRGEVRGRTPGARIVSSLLALSVVGLGVEPSARAEEPVIVLKDLRKPEPERPSREVEFYVNPEVAAARQGELYFRESPEVRRKQDYLVQSYFDPSARLSEHTAGMLQFEKAVVSDALDLYGYDPDELQRFLYTDRENAIGVLIVALQGALAKKEKSPVEQAAVAWLQAQVQAKRVRAAEIAKEQYALWTKDPCGYARVKPKELAYEGPGPVCGGGRYAGLLTTADPPSYTALQEYGASQAHSLFDEEKTAILELLETQMARSIAALSTAAATTALTTIGIPAGLSIYYGTVAQGGYLFTGPIAGVVLVGVVTAVKEGVSVVEKEALPGKLAQALARARSQVPSELDLQTEAGLAESVSALADATRLDPATQRALDAWNDQNNLHYLARGLDFAGFNRRWKQMSSRGFHLADLETYVDARGARRWDGLFLPGAQRGYLARTETTEGFAQRRRDLSSQGLELIDVETYVEGGQRRWAGVWGPKRGKGYFWRGASTKGFGAKYRELIAQGYRLIDIETYVDGGQRKWAGVFVEGSGPHALWRNASLASFKTKVAQWSDRQLIDVETYEENGQQRWVGVWAGPASGPPKMAVRTPAAELPDGWSKDTDQLREHESYVDEGQRRSIAIWSQR